ncbi:hypothetical protein DEA06_07920 [Microbacterium sp. Gd 4-13]|nr:hypothetical protein DEA06_07920 [Microbacterium sp. Gd 4-13]
MESERTEVLAPVVPVPAVNPESRGSGRAGRIAVVVVVVLVFVGLVFGVLDWIARSMLQSTISRSVIQVSGLPATQRVDTEISGPVLPQLLLRNLSLVTVSSQNVNLAGGAGDSSLELTDVSLGEQSTAREVRGELRIDASQLAYMAAASGGSATFGFDGADVTASTAVSAGGRKASVGLTLAPGHSQGAITLTTSLVRFDEAQSTVDDLRARYGDEALASLQPRSVCLATELPATARITSVAVEGQQLVARFAVDATALDAAALGEKGTCG